MWRVREASCLSYRHMGRVAGQKKDLASEDTCSFLAALGHGVPLKTYKRGSMSMR